MDKHLLAEIQGKVEAILDAEIAKGYSPTLVTVAGQDAKTSECRICGETKGSFGFLIVGRELRVEKVYIYCIPMVCVPCHGDNDKAGAFLDRLEWRYRKWERKR